MNSFKFLIFVESYIHRPPAIFRTKTYATSSKRSDNELNSNEKVKISSIQSGNPSNLVSSPSDGQVFVCTNSWCRERGSDGVLAAFTFLTPENTQVVGVNCLGRCNKGPNIRILSKQGKFIEETSVRSIETVVELLQKHLSLAVNYTSAEVLKLNYEGNIYLRNGDVDNAISCYDRALELGDKEQEGVLLVMRGTALLQRAYASKLKYKDILAISQEFIPTKDSIILIFNALHFLHPSLRLRLFSEILAKISLIFKSFDYSSKLNEYKIKWNELKGSNPLTSGENVVDRGMFIYSLYEHALMKALQDLLTATIVLPGFAQAWRRSGDALSEIRLYRNAIEYYEVAIKLDESMESILLPTIEKLKILDKFTENAKIKGWGGSLESILSILEE